MTAITDARNRLDRAARSGTFTYTKYELLRTFRSIRFTLFSLVFPLILYVVIAGPNRHAHVDHVSLPVYFMTGMAAWGTMGAVMGSGARIAAERAVGWHRQMRLTPLKVSAYFRTKALGGYIMAALSILVLAVAGTAMGVRLSAAEWAEMVGLMFVGLIPFTIMGILIGHLVTVDALGPALGGTTALFALLGGSWGPIAGSGALRSLTELIPSFWLTQSGKVALGGDAWPLKAWLVILVWSLVLGRIAVRVYRRDTNKV